MAAKVYLGSDHAGYALKERLQGFLARKGFETIDLGTHSPEPVDYPDYAFRVAEKVAKGKKDFGLLVCSTGTGMCIAANKVKGIRAAGIFNEASALGAREHNNANIICLQGRSSGAAKAERLVQVFFSAKPSKEARHARRIEKISKYEKGRN